MSDEFNRQEKVALVETAKKALGKKRGKKNVWITEAILDNYDEMRTLKLTVGKCIRVRYANRNVNSRIKKRARESKEQWIRQTSQLS